MYFQKPHNVQKHRKLLALRINLIYSVYEMASQKDFVSLATNFTPPIYSNSPQADLFLLA